MSAYPGAIEGNSSRGVTPGLIDPMGPDVEANRVPLPNFRKPYNKKAKDGKASKKSVSESSGGDSSTDDDTPEPSSARGRTSTEILADRLLIVATQGARALEPGASTDFEEWST